MKFLVDRCAGGRLAQWLALQGHDVVDSQSLGQDPGDAELLRLAAGGGRILITIDTDFMMLVKLKSVSHSGIVRLPDVPAVHRIKLLEEVIQRHGKELENKAIITVKGGRIRVTY
jgi:predicted nuclease of predicted toxin-antitoxin system